MSLLFFSPSRTVLLMSDEALFVYKTSGSAVSLVASVPWKAQNFEDDVAQILKKECHSRPVVLLNDMVEQHYRKERVIKKGVGVLDRASMVKRKLAFSFPNYPIRASMMLQEKSQATTKEQAVPSDSYIFAAIPHSDQFQKTLDAIKIALVPIAGLCLLPVESSGMVSQLTARLEGRSKSKSKWSAFIGQHHGGGLRQIVTRDGQIAMTRITPISSSEKDPDQWAQEVFQEFSATMSYVTRFGYQSEDGLHVVIIADGDAGAAVENLFQEKYNADVLSSKEAASILRINIGRQAQKGFATALHIAWVGRKTKFTLPMQSDAIEQVSQPRKIASVASFLMVLLAVGQVYMMLSNGVTLTQVKSEISDKRDALNKLQSEYDEEVKRKEDLGFNIKLVQSAINVHETLEKKKIPILPLMEKIGEALGTGMRVDQISVKEIENSQPLDEFGYGLSTDQPKFGFEVVMQITYPKDVDVFAGNAEVQDFSSRLARLLPDHDVEVTKKLKDYEYVEEIKVQDGEIEEEDKDLTVEVTVKGPTG